MVGAGARAGAGASVEAAVELEVGVSLAEILEPGTLSGPNAVGVPIFGASLCTTLSASITTKLYRCEIS